MSRWPIRLRITMGFAAAMVLLLMVVGVAAHQQLAAGLSDDLDRVLQQRVEDLSGLVSRPGSSSLQNLAGTGLIERGESFAQVLTKDGRVLESTNTLGGEPLLSRAEAAQGAAGSIMLDRPRAPGLNEPVRLLATPMDRGGQRLILVVGITRENSREALSRVRTQLLIGLPLLLLLTTGLGYLMAGAALRPVEAMRRRAAGMSGGSAGQRLPLPPGNDELARLGVTLNELLARVDAALERERTFVANASHELRTPLALLRTELELAVRRPRPVQDLTRAVSSAIEEVDRLIRLAEDLLLLANTDGTAPPLATQRVDVPALLERVAERFKGTATATQRHLHVDAGTVRHVAADPQRLEQALNNLVANAIQHGAGTISLSAREAADTTELRVTDQGEGFTDTMLARGFDRFAHTPAGGGTGLGLSIVAAVAQTHGGTAGIANLAPRGSLVWIRVPRKGSPRPRRGA